MGSIVIIGLIVGLMNSSYTKKSENYKVACRQQEHLDFDRKLGRINDQEYERRFRELEKTKEKNINWGMME